MTRVPNFQNRIWLTEKVIKEALLPREGKTRGYFTINQLRALLLFIKGVKETHRDRQCNESSESKGI